MGMWFRRKSGKSSTANKDREVQSAPKASADIVLERVRLPVDLLQPGMKVVKLDRPWTEVPVLFQGFTLQTEAETRILRQYCTWVVVEDQAERLTPVLDKIPRLKQRTTEPLQETHTLEQELPRAADTWNRTQHFVEKVIQNIELDNDLELASAGH